MHPYNMLSVGGLHLKYGFQNEVFSSKSPTSFSRGPLAVIIKRHTERDMKL